MVTVQCSNTAGKSIKDLPPVYSSKVKDQLCLPNPTTNEELTQTENQPSLKGNTGHQTTNQHHTTN
jgi:hypothetical protein